MKLKTILVKKQKQLRNLSIEHGFVVCGDIHLFNAYPYNNHESTISSRLQDINKALTYAGKVARRLGLPLIINGDVLMTGILDYPVEHILLSFLAEFEDVEIYINLGNHDLDGENSVITPLLDYGNNQKHYVIERGKKISLSKNVKLFFMPYAKISETLMTLKNFVDRDIKKKNTNVLFIHNQFVGSAFSNKVKSLSGLSQNLFTTGRFSSFDLIVASHVHKYQKLCDGKGFYTSSIIPLDFGERSKEHGFHIVDLDNKTSFFVIPNAPKFKYIKISQINDYTKEELKLTVRGNIVCIKNDEPNKELDKKKVIKKLLHHDAKFVTLKKATKRNESKKKVIIKESETVKEIVSSYSKLLSKKHNLRESKMEQIGLEIIDNAKKLKSSKTQKR